MEKTIYLIRGSKTESYAEFKDRILNSAYDFMSTHSPDRLKLVLTEYAPPLFSIIPFQHKKIAVLSSYADQVTINPNLVSEKGYAGSYHVTEALPVSYAKTWTDGVATPGVCLLTLFNKKKGISYDGFIDTWHNSHTPLSLKFHPLWNYNRNVVTENGANNKENWDGIVEEHFKTKEDLLNPFRFFGNPFVIIQRMMAVYQDTKKFIDYPSMQPYLAVEYHLKG
jgi:hypothetical protein